jgi:hypothetical protein
MATEHPQATVRSLVNGTGFGSVAAACVPLCDKSSQGDR